jgi:hypothetical protein
MRRAPCLGAAGLVVLLSYAGASAETAVINASKDNTIYQDDFGLLSNGAGQRFFAGISGNGLIRRGLISFDIASAIPTGATIDSVTLRLNVSNVSNVNPAVVELHRVLTDWGEGDSLSPGGEGQGGDAQPGDATWLHTFYDTGFWTQPGGDFAPGASGAATVGGIGVYAWNSTPGMVADVQAWLDQPAGNFGWIVIGDESTISAKRFDSRQNVDALRRPTLIVDYSPIPEPFTAGLMLLGLIPVRRRGGDVVRRDGGRCEWRA